MSTSQGLLRPRYGRMTYTSFDQGAVGGWQVKQQELLDGDEVDLLRSLVTTQLDPGFELPRFPSPAEVGELPRRLVYGPVGPGRAAWWHTAPAGADGSGRPGNVFVDVILDRDPSSAVSRLRPIEMWQSQQWLTPFGAEAVRKAVFDALSTPKPGSVITPAEVMSFVLDLTHFRLGMLGALLDACAAALRGGPRVVLVTRSVDHAARWVGALSYLMPTAYAQRFYFSTLERASALASCWERGMHLVAVPPADAQTLRRQNGLVLLDDAEDVAIGDLGGRPHVTAASHEIAVTEWSVIAQVVLSDTDHAITAIELLDEVAERSGSAGREPGWALAMVVSQASDLFPDAVSEAAPVIARSSPPTLALDGQLFAAARNIVADQAGSTTEEAWHALSQQMMPADEPGVMVDLLLDVYAHRAVRDLNWLARPGGVPLPHELAATFRPGLDLRASVAATENELTAEGAGALRRAAVAMVRLADFIVRLGGLTEELAETLSDALDRWFIYQLFEPVGVDLVSYLGPLDERTHSQLIRPLVELASDMVERPVGERLPKPVLFWLFPEGDPPLSLFEISTEEGCRLRCELAVAVGGLEPAYAAYRPSAVWALLAGWSRGEAHRSLAPYFASPKWRISDVAHLEHCYPGLLDVDLLGPTLKGAPASTELTQWTREFARNRARPTRDEDSAKGFWALLATRDREHLDWVRGDIDFGKRLVETLRAGLFGVNISDVDFDPVTLGHIQVAFILAAALNRHRVMLGSLAPYLASGEEVLSEDASDLVSGALRSHSRIDEAAFAAIMSDPRFPHVDVRDARFRWLELMTVSSDGVQMPVLLQHVRQQANQPGFSTDALREELLGRFSEYFRKDGDNADRWVRTADKFAGAWLKGLQPTEGRLSRWKARAHE